MICPTCGMDCPSDFAFCPACGTGLTTTCPDCGFEGPANVTYCPQCGTPLAAQPKPDPGVERLKRHAPSEYAEGVLRAPDVVAGAL